MALRLSSFNMLILGFLLLQVYLSVVNGLRCYKCLETDCWDTDVECNEIRSYIQSELKLFYYFETDLNPCPSADQRNIRGWLAMKDSIGDSCPGNSTCALGRIEFESKEYNSFGDVNKVRRNYATVLGCAKPFLMNRVSNSFNNGKCDYANFIKSSPIAFQQIEMEHCQDIKTYCSNEDYCINWWLSGVLSGRKPPSNKTFTIVMIVLVIFGILFLGLLYMFMFQSLPWISRFQRVDS